MNYSFKSHEQTALKNDIKAKEEDKLKQKEKELKQKEKELKEWEKVLEERELKIGEIVKQEFEELLLYDALCRLFDDDEDDDYE